MLACPLPPLATAYAVWLCDAINSGSFRGELLLVMIPSLLLLLSLLLANFNLLRRAPDLGMYYAGASALLFVPAMFGIGGNDLLELFLGLGTGLVPGALFLYFALVRAFTPNAEQGVGGDSDKAADGLTRAPQR